MPELPDVTVYIETLRTRILGQEIRGIDDRLAVRPDSLALADAVTAWSAVNGADALGGKLGGGRDGNESEA